MEEQAVIQWALTQRESEPYLAEVATVFLKLVWQHVDSQADLLKVLLALGRILYHEGEKDNAEDFCRNILKPLIGLLFCVPKIT